MQEVFSKIIERLETERLKREEQLKTCHDSDAEDYFRCKMSGIADAIEIVKQAAVEYNNGWIPCSERLPDEAFGCLVTVMDCEPSTQTDFENILPYFVGYDGQSWNNADGEEIPFEVIAWRKLPEPYQTKGE